MNINDLIQKLSTFPSETEVQICRWVEPTEEYEHVSDIDMEVHDEGYLLLS